MSGKEDKIKKAQKQTAEVAEIARHNIELALKRGEQLEEVQAKANILEQQSIDFRKNSEKVKNKMCWQNWKSKILIGLVVVVVLVVAIALIAVA